MGFGVGVLAGMFGVGGGFLMTPLLIILFGVEPRIAVGTGLCQMIGVAVAAQIRYRQLGLGESKLALMMTVPALLGVNLGARTVAMLATMDAVKIGHAIIPASKFYLALGYIVLLTGVAAYMAFDLRRGKVADTPKAPPFTRIALPPYTHLPQTNRRISIPVVTYLGLFLGYLSGVLGVGGGVLLTPLLLYGIGMSVAMAAGTGVGLLLATSLVGTFTYASSKNVDIGIAVTLLVGATFGAQIGAALSARFDGTRLRSLFVGLVALTAAAVLFDLLRAMR
jgi:uncharacterized membrane protein YfcA